MRRILIILSLVSIAILVSLILPANFSIAENETTPDPKVDLPEPLSYMDLKLGNLQLGMSFQEVAEVMKSKLEKVEEPGLSKYLDYSDGTSIVITDGRVQFIIVTSNLYQTPRGLAVGDSKENVIRLYGKPNETFLDDTRWLYNIEEGGSFTVTFDGDKITDLSVLIPMD